MLAYFSIYVSINVISCYSGYNPTRLDGGKDLWCPEHCYEHDLKAYIDHCCACEGIPEWELQENGGGYLNVSVEILNVDHSESKIITRTTSQTKIYHLLYTRRNLVKLPSNACEIKNLVKIDVSENRFSQIGNMSCFTELDTLIMIRNMIHTVSNETFLYLPKLRYLDLSYNQITKMDYNVYQSSHVFHFNVDGNRLRDLDVLNIYKINKTACISSFIENNHTTIDITNVGNFQFRPNSEDTMCTSTDISGLTLTKHPILAMTDMIESREIAKYAPCGETLEKGTAFNCDCHLAELLHLSLSDFQRIYNKDKYHNYCSRPLSLGNASIEKVHSNKTLQDLMICDVVDFCPKNGNCKCTCTTQPSKNVLIIDCSNQSCTDFPEVIPVTKFNIVLNMSFNKVTNVHSRRNYSSKIQTLDLTGNMIQEIDINITTLITASDIIIVNHMLSDLPETIQLFEPNIFHFGFNGIPCECHNRWIGEWRLYKNASKAFPFALKCSNYADTLFESYLNSDPDCDVATKSWWLISSIILLGTLILITLVYFCCFNEIQVARRLLESKSLYKKVWEIDVYISSDEENGDVRFFVLNDLEKFFLKQKMTTYIPCRDAIFGGLKEENIRNFMTKCKYVVIVHSRGMYDQSHTGDATKCSEYNIAWDHFVSRKLARIFLIKFDRESNRYMNSRTRALRRCGLEFDICDRTHSLYTEILRFLDEPILVHSKYKNKRKVRIQANLQRKKLEIDE